MNTMSKNILKATALASALALVACDGDVEADTAPYVTNDYEASAVAAQAEAAQELDQAQYEASVSMDQAQESLDQAGNALGSAAEATGAAAVATTEAAQAQIQAGAQVTAEQAGRAAAHVDEATEPLQNAYEAGKVDEAQEIEQEENY